jgi:hypothetical protein
MTIGSKSTILQLFCYFKQLGQIVKVKYCIDTPNFADKILLHPSQ